MKVFIVGLGLIGGRYAYGLSQKGYEVYGCDKNIDAINYAKENKFIIDGCQNAGDMIADMDVVILSIYPQAILSFLEENNKYFNSKQIITDVCGVKLSYVVEATRLAAPAVYCAHHPMAGREKIGIEYAKDVIFEGANFLVTPTDATPADVVELIKKMGNDLGFARITVMSPDYHDKMIGFTSQLTHAIAVSLVNSDHDDNTKNYIGDSYRDLTRIAMINEDLWSELFLENKDFLIKHIISFEYELAVLKKSLIDNNKDSLKALFKSSTKIRKEMEK